MLKFQCRNMKKRNVLDYISNESKTVMLPCFKPKFKEYKAGKTIMTYDSGEPETVAVLDKGIAKLQVINDEGNIFLLEHINEGDIFGELFSLPLEYFAYAVVAETDCRVIYVDYDHIIKPCGNLCDHHSQLISNMFIMATQKSQELSLHLSFMHQTTIRKKLMSYLTYIASYAHKNKDGSFDIPISLGELSEYLGIDRSAMMREIKVMKDSGIIEGNRRTFKILEG